MKQLTALLLLLFGSATVLLGQVFSFGATCQIVAPIVTDAQIGSGWGLDLWSRSQFGDGSGMDIQIGWQEIGDYNSGIDLRNTWVFPEGTQRQRVYADLEKLRRFFVDLSFWRRARGGESPFAYALGARYSFGVSGAGTYEKSRSLSFGRATSFSTGLDEDVLRGRDLGILIGCRYDFAQGYTLKAQAYQGVLNQWKNFAGVDGPTVYVTTLSLGLAVQLFQLGGL